MSEAYPQEFYNQYANTAAGYTYSQSTAAQVGQFPLDPRQIKQYLHTNYTKRAIDKVDIHYSQAFKSYQVTMDFTNGESRHVTYDKDDVHSSYNPVALVLAKIMPDAHDDIRIDGVCPPDALITNVKTLLDSVTGDAAIEVVTQNARRIDEFRSNYSDAVHDFMSKAKFHNIGDAQKCSALNEILSGDGFEHISCTPIQPYSSYGSSNFGPFC